MLEVDRLDVYYGAVHALKGVTLRADAGEIVTLIGANGAGKSTTLRTISGLQRPYRGAISFQGRRIDTLPTHDIVRLGIAQAPEGRQIFPRMSVRENLEMGGFVRDDAEELAADHEAMLELFPRLRERLDQKAGTMSGGEQQMLAMGRALMARPKLLLLDEPSLGLAPFLVKDIFRIIGEINRRGTTVLLVEQNAHMALEAAGRGYVLETGEVVLADTGRALLNNPQVQQAYLGM
ncbi:MAG TPA: ABC transporter ATP-binding protein [Candidatus Eisenbacteria bacterium]|nr:ABC transporter ATP-binding protein [Candidatus Eisenbacteria bacterium]